MAIFVLDEYFEVSAGPSGSSGTPSVSVPISSNNGDTLVAIVAANSFGASPETACRISSVVDDANNVWFPAATGFAEGANAEPETAIRVAIWYCAGAAAASNVKATATQVCDSMAIHVIKLSGVTNIVPLDAADGNALVGDDDEVTADLTTTNDDDIVIAAVAVGDTGITVTFNDSDSTGDWVELEDVDATSVTTQRSIDPEDGVRLRSAYLIQTDADTQEAVWDLSTNGRAAWAAIALKDGDVDTTNPNPYWPQITHELGFGMEPNNPDSDENWVDVTDRVLSFSARRGRDYELTRVEAGEADVRMLNDDGAFNPDNTNSPFYDSGNGETLVRLMTPYRIRARWNGQNYAVFTGYVERWPQIWDDELGSSPMEAVDGLATLSATRLEGALSAEILADGPLGYWPLDDGKLSREAANKAMGDGASLSIEDNGGGSGFFGADFDAAGEEGTCYEQTIHSTLTIDQDSDEGACLTGSVAPDHIGTGVLFEVWAKVPETNPGRNYVLMALMSGSSRVAVLGLDSGTGAASITVSLAASGTDNVTSSGPANYADDKWHHFVAHFTQTSVGLWVDGEEIDEKSLSASATSNSIDTVFVGGIIGDSTPGHVAGRFAHAAIFELSDADARRIAVRANAGVNGFPERSGARVARLLNYAGWTAGRAIDPGLSRLGSTATIARQTLLQAVQDVANWENGLAFVDGNGMFRFVDRNGRFFAQPKWVFGDGPNEIPYETDVEIQYDPKYVYNDVIISRNAGRTTGGGSSTRRRDQDSIKQYFTRNLDKTTGVTSPGERIAEAEWILENYAQPRLRLAHITITPSANPELWPVALNAEIGDRAIVRRRPFGGDPIELDCYIEKVQHQVAPNKWTVTYSLSPALVSTYGAESGWILNVNELGENTFLG